MFCAGEGPNLCISPLDRHLAAYKEQRPLLLPGLLIPCYFFPRADREVATQHSVIRGALLVSKTILFYF